jgi:hypothetical protein
MMDEIRLFYLLKQKILAGYKQHYPFYNGDITQFGNKEIAQLIDLIETECHERVSEKWVYTHLKPAGNTKLPRRDMLDIFCKWTGYNSWDEFAYTNVAATQSAAIPGKVRPKIKTAYIIMGIVTILILAIIGFTIPSGDSVTICLKDKYTQKNIEADKVTVNVFRKGIKEKLKRNGSCYLLNREKEETILLVESPYYKADTIRIAPGNEVLSYEFDLQPDDYAMMLRAYMNADVNDWNKRKKQLDEILSDDAVIQEIMFNEIGVEFLNKQEFINKITTPSKSVKTMEIVAIDYEGNKIISLKYIQK